MPNYNVQKFENLANGGNTVCYGKQDSHNHGIANQFTIDITDWLTWPPADWNRSDINPGTFRSHQSEPYEGKEFRWDTDKKKWVKV